MASEFSPQKYLRDFISDINPRIVLVDVHGTIAERPSGGGWELRPGASDLLLNLAQKGLNPVFCTWESPDSVECVVDLLVREIPDLRDKIDAHSAHHINRSNPPHGLAGFLGEAENLIPEGWHNAHWTSNKWPPGFGARIIIDDEYDTPFGLAPSDLHAQQVMNSPLFGWTGIPAQHPDDNRIGFPDRAVAQITEAITLWSDWQKFITRN